METLPLLEVCCEDSPKLRQIAQNLQPFDALAFTSANAVDAFFALEPDRRHLPMTAAVGPATAAALQRQSVVPGLKAQRRDGEGLAQALAERLGPGAKVLTPQADDARPELISGLRRAGLVVEGVVVYRKSLPASAPERCREIFAEGPLGWVTFTSPRIVRHFVDLFGKAWEARRSTLQALSIGPTTSGELRRQGIEPAAEARSPGAHAMVAAMVEAVEK